MTELDKLKRAKQYMEQLAGGIDPVTGKSMRADPESRDRLCRCYLYVAGILEGVIAAGGITAQEKKKKTPFSITAEQKQAVPLTDEPVSLSVFCARISEQAGAGQGCGSLSSRKVAQWLLQAGFLREELILGKHMKVPTEAGQALGVSREQRTGPRGAYEVNLYGRQAQEFLLDNLDAVLSGPEQQAE